MKKRACIGAGDGGGGDRHWIAAAVDELASELAWPCRMLVAVRLRAQGRRTGPNSGALLRRRSRGEQSHQQRDGEENLCLLGGAHRHERGSTNKCVLGLYVCIGEYWSLDARFFGFEGGTCLYMGGEPQAKWFGKDLERPYKMLLLLLVTIHICFTNLLVSELRIYLWFLLCRVFK